MQTGKVQAVPIERRGASLTRPVALGLARYCLFTPVSQGSLNEAIVALKR